MNYEEQQAKWEADNRDWEDNIKVTKKLNRRYEIRYWFGICIDIVHTAFLYYIATRML